MKKLTKKKKRKIKRIITTCVLILLPLLILGVCAYEIVSISKLNTIFPGVYIDNTSVAELSVEEAINILNANGQEKKITTPLIVTTIGGHSFEVIPKNAGTGIDAETLANEAYAAGRNDNSVKNCISYLRHKFGKETFCVSSSAGVSNRGYIGDCVDNAISAVADLSTDIGWVFDEENGRITLQKGAGEISIDRSDFIEKIIDALESGKTELSYTKLSSELLIPNFQEIYDSLPHDVKDAYFSDDGKFVVTDELVGYEFNIEVAEEIWNSASPLDQIIIPLEKVIPEVTGESLRSTLFRDLLGKSITYYPNSNEARRSNLRLATSYIDGMILYPGDVFSYNSVVGERTEEKGFQKAPAYFNGEETEEIGGGACQVSSTLYSASLFAFLETVERECHYFPVNYMQMGTDATVTIPTDGGRAIDFKFKNNKSYPIKLVGYLDNDESSITFEIWGTLEDEDFMPVEFDNSYNGGYSSDPKIEKAYADREGYVIRLIHETYTFEDDVGPGYRTLTYRRVYDESGNMVFEDITNMKNKSGNTTMDTYYIHNH